MVLSDPIYLFWQFFNLCGVAPPVMYESKYLLNLATVEKITKSFWCTNDYIK